MAAESAPEAPLRVDFYVLAEASDGARLKLACRIAEKAYLAGQRVALLCTDPAVLRALDELLWTFADGSFVPHERAPGAGCPVVLCAGAAPADPAEVLVNLDPGVPPRWPGVARIAEILDGDGERRAAARARFKHYRSVGIEPRTHNV